MIREIQYTGYTAQPSDYESSDGELAYSLNLIPEDSRMRPVAQPSVAFKLSDKESVILIHSTPGAKHYILGRKLAQDLTQIYWVLKSDALQDTSTAEYITTVSGFKAIEAIGNTLVLAVHEELKYLLWKDGHYKILDARPPFINIDFGMFKISTLTDSEEYTIPANCAPTRREPPTAEESASFTQKAYALLNPIITDKIIKQGHFYQPFFVRYAFRLYDGSYNWHSAPILMLPTITPPIIKYTDGGTQSDGTHKATFKLNVPYFSLRHRILAHGLTKLDEWQDIIAGIDIFVSAPIYTYDQSKDIESVTNSRNMLLGLHNWNPDNIDPRNEAYAALVPDKIFIGHYCDGSYGAQSYIDHHLSTSGTENFAMLNIPRHSQFHNHIRGAQTFYKFAEIDSRDIKATTELKDITQINRDLSALVTRETLSDDYRSHCGLSATSLYAFNSRLNLAGVNLKPPMPFSLRSCTQFSNPESHPTAVYATITVWSTINGQKCKAVRQIIDGGEAEQVYSAVANFPRYIFYPDSSAYKMEIAFSASQKFRVNLVPHEFLNGAYYYSDNLKNDPTPANVEPETADVATSVKIGAKIYTSEINNPFLFPLLGINTVGSGNIIKICSAAKALSQGQFGQFPLYAFTDEGVWALEVTGTGTYSAKQPITRDVCINPDGVTQIDSAVLFPTQRGIMLLTGSQADCISDAINTTAVFNLDNLPGMQKIHELLNHANTGSYLADSCLPLQPFTEFLSDCRMVYDYTNQRLVVYNPSRTYAYLYSFKSKRWGLMYSRVQSDFNSYPDAYAVDFDGNVVDFSHPADTSVPALLVTRPLKLDAPNVLKTIDTIIQRGDFRRGHVQSVLYGSRDLVHWHPVWSSKDHELRGFSGSAYKWFRIALISNLEVDESIFGASVQFSPKFNDKLR